MPAAQGSAHQAAGPPIPRVSYGGEALLVAAAAGNAAEVTAAEAEAEQARRGSGGWDAQRERHLLGVCDAVGPPLTAA